MVDNGIRVQTGFVSEKFRPWLIRIVLGTVILAFVGFSIIPIYSAIRDDRQATTPTTATSDTTVTKAKKSELQAQEKGYEAVLQREPENQAALQGILQTRLQKIQAKTGEVKDVIGPLQKLSQLNPERTEYKLLLAQAQQQIGNQEEATQNYQAILAIEPGNIKALQGLVALRLQQQQPQVAVGLLQKTLDSAPQINQTQPGSVDVPQVQLLLAEVYALQQQYDQAISTYDQIIAANKNDFRPVLGKALVFREQGNNNASQSLFDSAVTLAPAQYKDQIKRLSAGGSAPFN